MKTLILGLGNAIMRDDAAGVVAAERLAGRVPAEVVTGAASGLAVLDQLVGYDRAIIVDATLTDHDPPGTIRRHQPDAAPAGTGPAGAHHASLDGLLAWGRRAWPGLPAEIVVYTIEAAQLSTVGEGLSPAVERGVERLVARIVAEQFASSISHPTDGAEDDG